MAKKRIAPEKELKIKLEKAKDNGYDIRLGEVKLDGDGMKNCKQNKSSRAYYFKEKKHNNRVVLTITDQVKAEKSSMNLKKVLEAIERSTLTSCYQNFLKKLYLAVTSDALLPIRVSVHVSDIGFSVGINENPVYACNKIYWTAKELTKETLKKVTTSAETSHIESDSELLAEGYKQSL